MDQLTGLRMFVRVAQRRSFTAVAVEQGMSQSTVSRYIRELEERLHVRLLQRSTRQLALTDVGEAFLVKAVRVLEQLDEAEAEASQSVLVHTGRVRITAPMAFSRELLVPVLATWIEANPRVAVDLIVDDRYIDLITEGIDFAIRIGPLAESTLRSRKLGNERLVITASPAYLERRGTPRVLGDLRQHSCLVVQRRQGPLNAASALSGTGSLTMNNIDTARAGALAGLGVATLPRWLLRGDLASGALVALLEDDAPVPLPVYVVFPPNPRLRAPVRSCLNHVVRGLSSCKEL